MSRLMREVGDQPAFFWRDDIPLERRAPRAAGLRLPRVRPQRLAGPALRGRPPAHGRHAARSTRPTSTAPQRALRLPGQPAGRAAGRRRTALSTVPDCGPQTAVPGLLPRHLPGRALRRDDARPRARNIRRICSAARQCGTDDALSIVGIAGRQPLVGGHQPHLTPARSTPIRSCWPSPTRSRTPRTGRRSSARAPSALVCGLPCQAPCTRTTRQSALSDFAERHGGALGAPSGLARPRKIRSWRPLSCRPILRELPAYRAFVDGAGKPIPPDLLHRPAPTVGVGSHRWSTASTPGWADRWRKPAAPPAGPGSGAARRGRGPPGAVLPEEIGLLRGEGATRVRSTISCSACWSARASAAAWLILCCMATSKSRATGIELTKTPGSRCFRPSTSAPAFPRFLTDTPQRDVFDAVVSGASGRQTWYVDWARRSLSATWARPTSTTSIAWRWTRWPTMRCCAATARQPPLRSASPTLCWSLGRPPACVAPSAASKQTVAAARPPTGSAAPA